MHFASAQLGDAVHPVQQHAVVADQQQRTLVVVEHAVELGAGIGVEVVGRFVEQQHVGPLEQFGGQPDRNDLAAAQRAQPAIERDVPEAEPVELGAGAFLDVPLVADRGEHLVAGIAAGQRVERIEDGCDAEHVGHAAPGVERQRLRKIADAIPSTVTEPADGRYSPAISFSSVLLPAPLGATRPVWPSPTVKDNSSNSGVSPGHEKDRFEQTMEVSDM